MKLALKTFILILAVSLLGTYVIAKIREARIEARYPPIGQTVTVNGTGGAGVVGRLLGIEASGTINNSFSWASSLCDSTGAAGACNALGSTHANEADFYNVANQPMASWDFTNDWLDQTVTYPKLQWEP